MSDLNLLGDMVVAVVAAKALVVRIEGEGEHQQLVWKITAPKEINEVIVRFLAARIGALANNKEQQTHALAMLKVGSDSGHAPEEIVKRMLADFAFKAVGYDSKTNKVVMGADWTKPPQG